MGIWGKGEMALGGIGISPILAFPHQRGKGVEGGIIAENCTQSLTLQVGLHSMIECGNRRRYSLSRWARFLLV